jgi:hypothetical protein
MKQLILTAAMSLALFTGDALAHGSHSAVDENGAKSVAARAVQKMTVRDFGYQVGQLAPEWRNISDSQAVVKEAANGFYIIEITRSGSDEKVYVKVMQNGSVSEVTNSYPF